MIGLAPLAFSGPRPLSETVLPSASPSAEPTETPAAAPTEPEATPEGTPAPPPTAAVDTDASASVAPPPPAAKATPTPTAQPGLWRVEGYVLDEAGNPLKGVCVVVGPHGCQRFSPHTDDRGHYFLDVAANVNPATSFDFYFEMPGRQTVWWHFTARGPMEFNVVLQPSN